MRFLCTAQYAVHGSKESLLRTHRAGQLSDVDVAVELAKHPRGRLGGGRHTGDNNGRRDAGKDLK